jgi:hypothetical protein
VDGVKDEMRMEVMTGYINIPRRRKSPLTMFMTINFLTVFPNLVGTGFAYPWVD